MSGRVVIWGDEESLVFELRSEDNKVVTWFEVETSKIDIYPTAIDVLTEIIIAKNMEE